ncbi:hypothetical protein [Oceanicola sp. 22II-s10i]|uniref:hypothetical protein n=1 Tax=Oceanicola sp. 22II-s10i TaxID=1317116 RepID=UPI000B522A49|nr:hypothetical protein [Oceanicola sp. 22II-s10i]
MTDHTDPEKKAKAAAHDVRDDLSHKAQELASDARETAQSLAADARQSAYDYGTGVKNHAASETSKMAEALRAAASDLQDGSIQERLVGRLAENVADAADGLRDRDIDDIGRDFSEYARRNPLFFLGGAALVGFAAGRFLKATGGHDDGGYGPQPTPAYVGRDGNADWQRDELRAHPQPHAGSDPHPEPEEPSKPLTSYNAGGGHRGLANGVHK